MAKSEENSEAETTFFDGKLQLHRESFLAAESDVLVVPCFPDLLCGGEVFKNVFDNAGPALTNALRPYISLEAGSCKLTSSFELKNFKKLAMCVLPELFDDEGLSRLDRVKVSMCIADALDLSVESSATSVVFTHWPIASVEQSAEILILCIAHWLRNSIYAEKLTTISLFLDMTDGFESYCHVAQLIEADPSLVLDVLQARRPDDYSHDPTVDADMVENVPLEYVESSKTPLRMHWNSARMMLDRRQPGAQNSSSPFLFYSRNLSTSILSIEQPDGTIHQYRLSTTVYDKNTHYFRCSRCDYLTRMHPEAGLFRPKITVRDGQIASDRYPTHHPQCHGIGKENFVVQQLDRLWKAIATYETDELRRCYVTLRNIASKEANSLYNEMENPEGHFPEWEILRQTAEKYHDQYSMRLIKCANADGPSDLDGVNIDQYSEIRRVEGELDGVQNNGIAWLTEGIDVERDEHEPEDTEAVPTSSGINTRSTQSVVTKRIVPVKTRNETHVVVGDSKMDSETSSKRPQRTVKPTYKLRSSNDTSNPTVQPNLETRVTPSKRSRN
ncbi:hypothetical protein M3Y95_00453100 [Aphelenchoides besseyi]|nr:hypothetical protein M3Y95_00453100 [Aphelenchoides besseyi]